MAESEFDRIFREAKPSWMDGEGVRGPQPAAPSEQASNMERRTDAPKGEVIRQPQPTTTEAATEADTTSDVIDMYGAHAGQPYIFHLKQDSAPTPVEDE